MGSARSGTWKSVCDTCRGRKCGLRLPGTSSHRCSTRPKATVLLLDELGGAAPAHCGLGPRVGTVCDRPIWRMSSIPQVRPGAPRACRSSTATWSFLRRCGVGSDLAANDVMLMVTTLAFDIAELEYWLPLSVGAPCVLLRGPTCWWRQPDPPDGGQCSLRVPQATPAAQDLLRNRLDEAVRC